MERAVWQGAKGSFKFTVSKKHGPQSVAHAELNAASIHMSLETQTCLETTAPANNLIEILSHLSYACASPT